MPARLPGQRAGAWLARVGATPCLQSEAFACCDGADLAGQLSVSSREIPSLTLLMARRSCWAGALAAAWPLPGVPSQRLVPWWCGVLAEGHRPRLQIGVTLDRVHEPSRSADAGPVVVPQRRHQPGAVSGKHQVGQFTRPERPAVTRAPGRGLVRSRLDQHVMPPCVQGHLGCVGEDDVIGAGVSRR
jgi:hypothetical protein